MTADHANDTSKGLKEREKNSTGRTSLPIRQADKDVSQVLESIADAHQTSLFSVALSYVLNKEPYVFPIIGGRKVEQLEANIRALPLKLSDDDVQKIESAYPFEHGFPHMWLSGSILNDSKTKQVKSAKDVWVTKTLGSFDYVESPRAISQ